MWLAAVFAVLAALGTAYQAKVQSNAAQRAADYNAKVSKKNADIAAEQASLDAQAIRDKNKRVLASQRAAYGASGVEDSGTATDVSADSAAQGEMDALIALYTGRSSASANNSRATLYQMESKDAKRSGNIGVATSLLGGASSAYSAYKNPSFR